MPARLPLSVPVITLNEEANLPRCLTSIHGLASEIVVVDSGSVDRTGAIAREYGARFDHAPWEGWVRQVNRALERCTQPWVLALDADEVVSPELAESIRDLFGKGDPAEDGFWINRRTFYLGEWIWNSWYPERRLRLVRRTSARWVGTDPHYRLETKGLTGRLHGDLLHYSFRDLEDHFQRTLRYARISAEQYSSAGRRVAWSRLLLSPAAAILKQLVLKQGWRDGWRGWVIAGVTAVGVFAKYAYLLERTRSGKGRSLPQRE
jgi:glycosyltransferase involved in cell wall biosynthesis